MQQLARGCIFVSGYPPRLFQEAEKASESEAKEGGGS